jgi:pimeloyl-ACP methyl ester carboxylesterase
MFSKIIEVDGKTVPVTKFGKGELNCLFIGPGTIYLPLFPKALFDEITFWDADRYCTYPAQGPKVKREEIEQLTIESYIDFYEKIRQALGLGKVAVMGPSALGLVAHAYAKRYPASVSHVFLLNCPSTTKNLVELEKEYIFGNYAFGKVVPFNSFGYDDVFAKFSPRELKTLYPHLQTQDSSSKWDNHLQRLSEYRHYEDDNRLKKARGELLDDSNRVLAKELFKEQLLYSVNPETEEVLFLRWQSFNTTTRAHFFGKLLVGASIYGKIDIPTLVVAGIKDGVAPSYDIPDKMKKAEIHGQIDVVILPECAHSPQFEVPEYFTRVILNWVHLVAKAGQAGFGHKHNLLNYEIEEKHESNNNFTPS